MKINTVYTANDPNPTPMIAEHGHVFAKRVIKMATDPNQQTIPAIKLVFDATGCGLAVAKWAVVNAVELDELEGLAPAAAWLEGVLWGLKAASNNPGQRVRTTILNAAGAAR